MTGMELFLISMAVNAAGKGAGYLIGRSEKKKDQALKDEAYKQQMALKEEELAYEKMMAEKTRALTEKATRVQNLSSAQEVALANLGAAETFAGRV